MYGSGQKRVHVNRKRADELEIMAEAGRISALALHTALEALVPGVSTLAVDELTEEVIRKAGASPSFKGFQEYPASTCISINDAVVHGIPSDDVVVREGDIVGVDVGAFFQGFHGDNAATKAIGEVSDEARRLLRVTEEALHKGIGEAVVGHRLKAVSSAVQGHAQAYGYSVVRDLLGHGIGRQMHEPPQVPNYYEAGAFADYELTLRPGMTLAIEPMINVGGPQVVRDTDGWTTRTADGSLSAHFEHTIVVTKEGPRILTPRD